MELKMIKLSDIITNPLQPRQEFDRDKLNELANSIKEGELLQPIVVRNNKDGYEIVCGERRFKAFERLKEPKIPAIVRDIADDTDALEKSLIENLQRDDLTSVERENAVYELWKSNRYKSQAELSRKLGIDKTHVNNLIQSKEARNKMSIPSTISSDAILKTRGLPDETRKKVIEGIESGKIKSRAEDLSQTVSKLKEFPEPEQQLEILEEFEQQEDMSREIFDDIVRKKKEIADGLREPEHIISIESDNDKRMIQDYIDIKNRVFEINADHIKHFKNEDVKKQAIGIIEEIMQYLSYQLNDLGKIVVVDINEEKET